MRIRAILTAAGLAAAGLAVAPLGAAHADTSATLPLTSYYQMAVDAVHDHLFFSQGSASENSILVTDFSGNTVATITGQTGVMGIALSPDGSTLFAALPGAHEVTAISTATLQQTATYPLGGTLAPFSVAVQSGKLWVSYDAVGAGLSQIGDFDLSAASPVFETQAGMGSWYSAPMLAADPSDTGNELVAVEPGMDPAEVASYDTSADPPTVRALSRMLTSQSNPTCYFARDVAVVPGGSEFIPACTGPSAHYRYSTADLSSQGSYASGGYPGAIAIASQTGLVAAGSGAAASPDIYIYAAGGTTPLNEFEAGTSGIANRGLGLTADGSELFAVTGTAGAYTLSTYENLTLQRSALALTATPSVTIGQSVALNGTLRTSGGSPVAGATVTITRTGPGGTATFTPATGTDGTFTLTDTPDAAGSYVYTAGFAGNATLAPATATADVTVTKAVPALSISVTPASATYRPVVHVTVHLGTADSDKTVSVYAKPAGSTRPVLLKTGTVNSTGTMAVTFPATYSTTFSAVFAGDATYSAKTVTATASVAAYVVMKTGGYYASKRIGSVTYRLYHRAKRLIAAAGVAPNKHGECVKFDVQELYQGKWYDSLTGCGTLGAQSTVGGYFTLSKADLGYHYRIRAVYVRGKDTTNLSADSGWQYFIVEK